MRGRCARCLRGATSWLLSLMDGLCSNEQGKQGRERQTQQRFDFMMYFCLASARSEECLGGGKVNAPWLETRQSGPCSGHHQVC